MWWCSSFDWMGSCKYVRFLELIDEQNNLQWSITAKLSSLINSKWNSIELQNELETLVEKHSKITKELKQS